MPTRARSRITKQLRVQDARSLSRVAQEALRSRVVKAVRDGMSQTEAAQVFQVARSSVNKWSRLHQDLGTRGLRSQRRGRPPGRVDKNPRRKLRLSPARRRSLKLQGSYMGYMRQLKPREKARVKAVKDKKGFPAAIAVARRMVRGSERP